MADSPPAPTDPSPGLRESKKARTRLAISDIATALFAQDGFEHVTVSQIAAAADVAVKTVFNYFPTKEDLFFDRAGELIDGLIHTIVARPAGQTILGALRALLAENRVPLDGNRWSSLRDPERYEQFRAFIATEHAAPALRARRLVIADAWTEQLASAIADDLGVEARDPRPRVLAAMIIAAMGLRERTLSSAMLDRTSPRVAERRVRDVVADAFDRLELAFGDLDRPR